MKKDKTVISRYDGILKYDDIVEFLKPYAEKRINREDNEFPLSKNYNKTTKDKKPNKKSKTTKKIE